MPNPPSFLFICGLHRSGTSLLHGVLRDHPDISGFKDTGAPEDEGQHLQRVFPTARKFGGPGKFAFDANAHLTEQSPLVTEANRATLFSEWSRYWDTHKKILLEKSPPNIIRSRFLQAMFPESRFIFLLRHPIPTALATQKWAKTGVEELIKHWCKAHTIMLEDVAHLRGHLLLRYEDLMRRPEAEMKKIYDFLELPPQPLQEILKPGLNEAYFHQWEKYLAEHPDILQNLEALAPLPARFGYRFLPPYME